MELYASSYDKKINEFEINSFNALCASIDDDELEEMENFLYKYCNFDYSYLTRKEAKPMIIEDYIYQCAVLNLIDKKIPLSMALTLYNWKG